jgi:thiol-disulfide isomerase/thioredoxin
LSRLVLRPEGGKDTRTFEARDLRAAGRVALSGLAGYRGPMAAALTARKPYLLFFWATWCTFCKSAIPELLELERQRGIPIVAITDESAPTLESFFSLWSGTFPDIVAIDTERRVNEAFKVDGYPTFIVVDENGRVTMRSVGYRADSGIPVPGWRSPAPVAAHH